MAISLFITESKQKIVVNVPKYLTIETDVPATIFYTFDGTDPNISSSVYVSSLELPTDQNPLIVKIWASNGVDQSIILSETYTSTIAGARLSHADVTNASTLPQKSLFPFGSGTQDEPPHYGPQVGLVVHDDALPVILDGYDAWGEPQGSLNHPKIDYEFIYSETNQFGEVGRGIGTLPSTTIVRTLPDAPLQSSIDSKFFNPKAMIIFQSYEDTNNSDISQMNRGSFELLTKAGPRPASYYYNADAGSQNFGTALRPIYDKKNQTITYFYRDSKSNRMIRSVEKFQEHTSQMGVANSIFAAGQAVGSRYVFRWYPFIRKNIV